MNLCEFPILVLMKVLRFLDAPTISKTMRTNRFLFKTIRENRHKFVKRRMDIRIEEKKDGSVHVHLYPKGIKEWQSFQYHGYFLCKSAEQQLEEEMKEKMKLQYSCIKKTFLRSGESVRNKIGEVFNNFLKITDLTEFRLTDINELLLQKITTSLQSNRSLVQKLSLEQRPWISTYSLCQLFRSMRDVKIFELRLHPLSLNEEILRIPQICSAVDTVNIFPTFGVFPRRLSLTDSDILALSARNIKLSFNCKYSPTFIRAFVENLLSKKGPLFCNPFFNFLHIEADNLNPKQIFNGMPYQLHRGTRSGFIKKGGVIFEFDFDSSRFLYCLRDTYKAFDRKIPQGPSKSRVTHKSLPHQT